MRRLSSKGKKSPQNSTEDKSRDNAKVPDSASDSEGAEDSFEVAEILDSRFVRGKQQFKIRWKGYGADQDTWETENNLNCPELIAEFQERVDAEENGDRPSKSVKRKKDSPKKKSKSSKKVKVENGKDQDSDDNAEWEVQKIVDYVELKDGTRQFKVHWRGYSSKSDTWEPEANLNCKELIDKFMADLEKKESVPKREVRENRRTVQKYNPDLAKRQSRRKASAKRVTYHDLE